MPGLANDLNISEPGYVTHNGSGVFHGRTFQAGTGITLTNADGIAGNTTIASTASLTDLHTARFIVASSTAGTGANFTTIASAIAAAQGTGINSTVFLQPGTYTENFTLPPGINLCAYTCDALTPNVTIVGNITVSAAGTCSISGIRLQTNGAAFLTVSANAAIVVNLDNCYLNCTNATGISFSSASASANINITNCKGNLGTTGIGLFSHSSSGTMTFTGCYFTNSGGSSTANTCSVGVCNAYSTLFSNPMTFSGTGACTWQWCEINTTPQNATSATLGGGSTSFKWCRFSSGTASSLSISSSTNEIISCTISSSNANAITGVGTLFYAALTFLSTSSTVNVTTQNLLPFGGNIPGFSAAKSATTTNVTGNATVYTVICDTETYDTMANYNNATGTFTAPFTGKYQFNFTTFFTGCTIATNFNVNVVTTARTYNNAFRRAAGSQDCFLQVTCIADMTATNTATFTCSAVGEGADTVDIGGNGLYTNTWVQGRYLGPI